jgi:uncharacterized Zn-binding protein involved in type VI secretion
MGQPAANASAMVVAVDTHIVMVPSPGGPIPTPLPHPFSGPVSSGLVPTVTIAGQPAAVAGSVALGQPPHLPTPPGVSFATPPTNQAPIHLGSFSVTIGGQPAARNGDPARTCNYPTDVPVGQVLAPTPTVMIG